MKKNIFKFLGLAFAMAAILFAVGGAFGFFNLTFLNGGENFLYLGVAPVAAAAEASSETVTTEVKKAKSSDLLRPDIDKKITQIYQDQFPFDTIMREAGIKKKVNAYETKYYSVTSRGIIDTVNGNISAFTGTASDNTTDIVVDNTHIWNTHDELAVLDDGSGTPIYGADGFPLTFLVVAKSGSTLTCVVLNGDGTYQTSHGAIADGSNIARIGHAKSELDAMTDPYAVMPQPSSNFCQTNMAMVEESFISKLHEQEVKFDLADMYNQAMWDFRSMSEYIGLLGVKKMAYDPVAANYKYTAGGILRQITSNIEWDVSASGLGNDVFQSWAKQIFVGNNGSDTRVMFVGSDFMESLGGVPVVAKQLDGTSVEVKWGITFNKIVTNFGTLLVKHHPGFVNIGMSAQAVALDMNFVEKHVFVPLQVSKKDLITSGIKKADAQVIDETFCMVLKNPSTHAIVKRV